MRYIARVLRTLAAHPHLLIMTMLLASISLGTVAVGNAKSARTLPAGPAQIITAPKPLANSSNTQASSTGVTTNSGAAALGAGVPATTSPATPTTQGQGNPSPAGSASSPATPSPAPSSDHICAICPNHGVTMDGTQADDTCSNPCGGATPPTGACGICGAQATTPSRPAQHMMCPMYCVQ
jgi:hypothetical protein